MLPARILKPSKAMPEHGKVDKPRRYRSTAHRDFVRSHACCACGATAPIEVAHIRMGTDGGMGMKPSDYWTVSLCHECHVQQHTDGEGTFWTTAQMDPTALAMEFAKASPRWPDIRRHIAENV